MVQHGLQLSLIVGENVLNQAATILRQQLEREAATPPVIDQLNQILSGIPFEDVRQNLPTLALTLSDTLTPIEQQQHASDVQILANTPMPEPMRALTLAVSLGNIVGPDTVLRAAKILEGYTKKRTTEQVEANKRFEDLMEEFSTISFADLQGSLPTLAMHLCGRALTPTEREMLIQQATTLTGISTNDSIRTVTLITVVNNVVGEDALYRAARILKHNKTLKPPFGSVPPTTPPAPTPPPSAIAPSETPSEPPLDPPSQPETSSQVVLVGQVSPVIPSQPLLDPPAREVLGKQTPNGEAVSTSTAAIATKQGSGALPTEHDPE